MLVLQADRKIGAKETKLLAGKLLDEDSFDTLIEQDCNVVTESGDHLLHFRKAVIPQNYIKDAYTNIKQAAIPTNNRGVASGYIDENKLPTSVAKNRNWNNTNSIDSDFLVTPNGSKTHQSNVVMSGIMGYMDRYPRIPYCRTTAYNMEHPERFRQAMPFITAVNNVFGDVSPERYAAQHAIIKQTHPDFTIHNTVFTTITVNKNWQTAVHTDKGDYAEGLGVMSAMWKGTGDGCYFVFPAYRIGVNMRTGDVLCANVHEWHGNTPFKGVVGRYERIACVFYYRNKMKNCGSAAEELERSKQGIRTS